MIRGNYYGQPYNPLRITELILCIICLGLAIHILLHVNKVHVILKAILILVAASYVFITAVDVIVTSLLKPIVWTTWIVFTIMGALGFFLCTGLLMFVHALTLTIYVISIIVYAITGIVFLLEMFALIVWLLTTEPYIKEHKRSLAVGDDDSILEDLTPKTSTFAPQTVSVDQANQFPDDDFQLTDKAIQCPCKTHLTKGKFTYTKECGGKRFPPPKITTHGGTFHVSKDVAPILSSCLPAHSVNRCLDSSPRMCSSNQKADINCECMIPEAVRSRTVATSARTVPKQNQELCRKEQQTAPVHESVRSFAPGHYFIYPCTQCGGSHPHIAKQLPTLDENNCYCPGDEMKNQRTCCPCPYAKTLMGANKMLACSGTALEKLKLAPCRLEKTSDPSKCQDQPSSQPLHCDLDTPRPLSDRSQQTSFTDRSEDNICSDCLLPLEPYEKKEDKVRKCGTKDFSCNSLQNYSYLKTSEISECRKKETQDLLCMDQDTVLPGTADRSPPPTTVKVERYVMSHPQQQNPTVIDFDETKADVSYLVPTQCNQQEVRQAQNRTRRGRKESCSIM